MSTESFVTIDEFELLNSEDAELNFFSLSESTEVDGDKLSDTLEFTEFIELFESFFAWLMRLSSDGGGLKNMFEFEYEVEFRLELKDVMFCGGDKSKPSSSIHDRFEPLPVCVLLFAVELLLLEPLLLPLLCGGNENSLTACIFYPTFLFIDYFNMISLYIDLKIKNEGLL